MTDVRAKLFAFYTAIRKDVKRLFSSQMNAGMLLIGPLILIGLVGFAFQGNSLNNVTIGVHNTIDDFDSTISQLIEQQGHTTKFYDDQDRCKQDNKDGQTAACILLTQSNSSILADVHLDYSRSQFAAAVLSQVNTIFDEIKQQKLSQFAQQLGERAQALKEQLSSFDTSLSSLKSNLRQTKRSVEKQADNISLGVENKSLEEFPELQERFDVAANQLNETETYIDSITSDIEDNEERVETQVENAKDLLDRRGCQAPYPNIQGKSPQQINEALGSTNKPLCLLIWNYKQYFAEQAQTLETIQSESEQRRDQVILYRTQAKRAANQPVSALAGEEIRQVKQDQQQAARNISDGLDLILSDLNTSSKNFHAFRNSSLIRTLDQAETAVNPVKVQFNRYEEFRNVTMLDLLFPGILTCLVSFVGILVGSVLVMKERTSNAVFRNEISPVPTVFLQFSSTVTGSMISTSQILVVLAVALLAFNLQASFVPSLIPTVILVGAVFTLIGQVIGTFSPNEEISTLLSIITAVLLLLFSSLITPLAKMHPLLSTIFQYTPFNETMQILRQQLIFGESITSAPTSAITLVVFTVTLTALLLASKQQVRETVRKWFYT